MPSEHLLSELSLPEVQDSVCGKEVISSDAGGISPVAVVVPCLEFSPSADGKEQVRLYPRDVRERCGLMYLFLCLLYILLDEDAGNGQHTKGVGIEFVQERYPVKALPRRERHA